MLKFFKKVFFDDASQRRKAFLKGLEIFSELTDREVSLLANALHARTYHAGETIFVEGDIGRALFILESGQVELTKADGAAGPRKIYTIQPGEFFGEMALLEQLPRSASAVAAERAHLYLLYRTKLDDLLIHQPRIGVTVMSHLARVLSARLRRATVHPLPEARPAFGGTAAGNDQA